MVASSPGTSDKYSLVSALQSVLVITLLSFQWHEVSIGVALGWSWATGRHDRVKDTSLVVSKVLSNKIFDCSDGCVALSAHCGGSLCSAASSGAHLLVSLDDGVSEFIMLLLFLSFSGSSVSPLNLRWLLGDYNLLEIEVWSCLLRFLFLFCLLIEFLFNWILGLDGGRVLRTAHCRQFSFAQVDNPLGW